MTKKALIQLASRALAMNLAIWSVVDLAYMPAYVFAIAHHATAKNASAWENYMYHYDFILLVTRIVLSAGLFVAAVWIYRCGPEIENFLTPEEE
jgi:hypothetical protein